VVEMFYVVLVFSERPWGGLGGRDVLRCPGVLRETLRRTGRDVVRCVQLWSVETSQQLSFHDDGAGDGGLVIYCCHVLPSDDRLLTVAPSTDHGQSSHLLLVHLSLLVLPLFSCTCSASERFRISHTVCWGLDAFLSPTRQCQCTEW